MLINRVKPLLTTMNFLAVCCPRLTRNTRAKKYEAVCNTNDMGGATSSPAPLEKQTQLHFKARGPTYPQASEDVKKFAVPDTHVLWNVDYPEYQPLCYNSLRVVEKPVWADPDVSDEAFKAIKFNEIDGKTNRVSHMGKYELNKDGVPINIVGRTGMTGRGLLGKWGPNHAADPIVSRWKRDENKEIVIKDGKSVLEVVAIKRGDTKEWAIPGGMVDSGEHVSLTLKREFGEEALNSLETDEKETTRKAIDDLFHHGDTIYEGYVDDPRNTDNAWMETTAVNFHDEDNSTVGKIPLHAGDDAVAVQWLPINKQLNLFASHADFIEKTCAKHNAYFIK